MGRKSKRDREKLRHERIEVEIEARLEQPAVKKIVSELQAWIEASRKGSTLSSAVDHHYTRGAKRGIDPISEFLKRLLQHGLKFGLRRDGSISYELRESWKPTTVDMATGEDAAEFLEQLEVDSQGRPLGRPPDRYLLTVDRNAPKLWLVADFEQFLDDFGIGRTVNEPTQPLSGKKLREALLVRRGLSMGLTMTDAARSAGLGSPDTARRRVDALRAEYGTEGPTCSVCNDPDDACTGKSDPRCYWILATNDTQIGALGVVQVENEDHLDRLTTHSDLTETPEPLLDQGDQED